MFFRMYRKIISCFPNPTCCRSIDQFEATGCYFSFPSPKPVVGLLTNLKLLDVIFLFPSPKSGIKIGMLTKYLWVVCIFVHRGFAYPIYLLGQQAQITLAVTTCSHFTISGPTLVFCFTVLLEVRFRKLRLFLPIWIKFISLLG